MQIVGYILIFLGALWILSRLMNQRIQFRNLKDGTAKLHNYIIAELFMGFGIGALLIFIGIKLAT